jgi:putative membrane protein
MRFWRSGAQVVALALVAGLAIACEKQDGDDAAVASTDSLSPPAAPAPPAISDAQIAAVVVTANTADSAAGEMAQKSGTDAEVKEFGKRMATDHGAVNKQATAWATAAGITPEENDDVRAMKQDAADATASLQGKTGKDWDKTYIDHEVMMHQQVLDAIDQKLLPNAQNADLKKLLTDTRPAIQAHLDAAKAIQTKLNQ